jgi:DNA-binding transcriptional regulator YdaS (Cro superfamily)
MCVMANQLNPDDRKRLAALTGIDEQYLYQCLTGRRDMNPERARRAEVDTKGELTRQMLCQKTYAGIWPELVAPKPRKQKAEAWMTRLLSIFISLFGAVLAVLGYVEHEWIVAALGFVLTCIGLFGLTLKEWAMQYLGMAMLCAGGAASYQSGVHRSYVLFLVGFTLIQIGWHLLSQGWPMFYAFLSIWLVILLLCYLAGSTAIYRANEQIGEPSDGGIESTNPTAWRSSGIPTNPNPFNTMYANPTHLRVKRINLSLNEVEDRMAEAAAEFNGKQKSAFLRELVIEGLARMHAMNSADEDMQMRALQSWLFPSKSAAIPSLPRNGNV